MTVCVQAAGLPDRLRLVETAVMMNSMQNRLALYRNLPTLIGTGIYSISVSQTCLLLLQSMYHPQWTV